MPPCCSHPIHICTSCHCPCDDAHAPVSRPRRTTHEQPSLHACHVAMCRCHPAIVATRQSSRAPSLGKGKGQMLHACCSTRPWHLPQQHHCRQCCSAVSPHLVPAKVSKAVCVQAEEEASGTGSTPRGPSAPTAIARPSPRRSSQPIAMSGSHPSSYKAGPRVHGTGLQGQGGLLMTSSARLSCTHACISTVAGRVAACAPRRGPKACKAESVASRSCQPLIPAEDLWRAANSAAVGLGLGAAMAQSCQC